MSGQVLPVRAAMVLWAILSVLAALPSPLQAGVRRQIQEWYTQNYENKAVFLKIPVRGEEQIIHVRPSGPNPDPKSSSQPLRFKVGEQVRIQKVDFKGDSIRFKISSIDGTRGGELNFLFSRDLTDDFAQRGDFDVTLEGSLTEGLSYTEVDSAKELYIKRELDRFVDQLATSNNSPKEFVVHVLGESLPDYRALNEKVQTTSAALNKVESDLEKELKNRQRLESELARSEKELDAARKDLKRIQTEREQVSQELAGVQERAQRLQQNTKQYEDQITALVKNLNVKTSSTTTLGSQVEILNESLKNLRSEQAARSRELRDLNQRVGDLLQQNQKLDKELEETRKEKDKLWTDFSALTSNRQTLEARYIAMKETNEKLASALQLDDSLSLKRRTEERDGREIYVSELYLHDQLLGRFELEVPPESGTVHKITFKAVSPEGVKFGEEERKLYEILGKTLKLETSWESHSPALRLVLLDKEAIQAVQPRETIEWPWMFQGQLSQPATATLLTHLVSPDGRKIFLGSQDVTVNPGDLTAQLLHQLSPPSLIAGALAASVLFGMILGLRRRPHPPKSHPASGGELVIHKKL